MSRALGSHTVTVLRGTTAENDYGNSTTDWSNSSGTTVDGCSVQPVVGDEQTVGRDTVVTRWRLFAPYGTDLKASDRVRYAGDDYEVDGEVERWDFPGGYVSALLHRSR